MPAAEPSPAQPKPADSPVKNAILLVIAGVALCVAAYFIYQQAFPPNPWQGEISNEERATNFAEVTADQILDLPLTDAAGKPVSLRERAGEKHLVVVITRGSLAAVAKADKGWIRQEFPNICPYCSSQTTGIVGILDQFAAQDAEVLVVFPVSQSAEQAHAGDLFKAGGLAVDPLPVPMAFDVNLAAVEKLGLKAHLARPASFIIDRDRKLRFSYVAKKDSADRPSGSELLRHVTEIQAESQSAPTAAATGKSN